MPACYRLSHLKPDIALVGTRPHASARVVIVYDLLASGQAIKQTAMAVREITGAQTGAAVVLAGIGKKRSHLETKDGQRIRLSCLSWRKSAGPTLAESSRGSLLDLNWSVREMSRKRSTPCANRRQISQHRSRPAPTMSGTARSYPKRLAVALRRSRRRSRSVRGRQSLVR